MTVPDASVVCDDRNCMMTKGKEMRRSHEYQTCTMNGSEEKERKGQEREKMREEVGCQWDSRTRGGEERRRREGRRGQGGHL